MLFVLFRPVFEFFHLDVCITPFIPPYPFPSYLSLLLFIYPHFPYLA